MQTNHLIEALYETAQAHYIHNDFPETIQMLNHALEVLQDASHPLLGSIYFLLGRSYFATTQYREARRHCDKASRLFQADGLNSAVALCSELMGQIYCEQGQYVEAIQEYQAGLAVFQRKGLSNEDLQRQAELHLALGQVATQTEDTGLQHHHFLQSFLIAKRLNSPLTYAYSLLGLGSCYFQCQKYPMARKILIKAIQAFSTIDESLGIALALLILGQVYIHTIEYRRAVNALKYAYTLFQLVHQPLFQASSLVYLGRIFVKIDPDMTEKICRNVTDLLITQTSIHSQRLAEIILGRYSMVMALYYQQVHQYDLARSQVKEAMDIFLLHHCEAEYHEASALYQTLQSAEQPSRLKKNNILAFKLGIIS